MGWARFDDGYTDHPKIEEAGPWAELLDMRAIIHCARYETDGLVTKTALRRIGRDIPKVPARVLALIEVGRWSANESGGWWVHDFLKFNPSKEEKEAQRESGRERQRRHRSNGVTNASPSKGRGGETTTEQRARVPEVSRCASCGFLLGIDCNCPTVAPPDLRIIGGAS